MHRWLILKRLLLDIFALMSMLVLVSLVKLSLVSMLSMVGVVCFVQEPACSAGRDLVVWR